MPGQAGHWKASRQVTLFVGERGCMFATDRQCAINFGNLLEDANLGDIESTSLDIEKCAKCCFIVSGVMFAAV